jgi:eukaryotic-like serine/threonine-protein kinase
MPKSQAQRLDELEPESLFEHYQLLEQIGIGGQGVVWSALDSVHERLVAIKFHEPVEEQDTTHLAEFEKQARLLIPLTHPNILPIYEFGRSGQLRYLVSPYVAGGSLRELLDEAALSQAEILSITGEIVSALDYLHARNIIHRDLKPSNIFLDFDRRAYLADFGLARAISDTTVALHTGRGTLPYAPPEQHSLAELTAQSDIYSLGVMLFEMFTRHLPWHGEKSLGIQQLHTDDGLPDPIDSAPDAPPTLAAVLRTLTAGQSAHRPRSVAEAFNLVRAILPEPSAPAAGAGRPVFEPAGANWNTAWTLLARGTQEWKF